MTAAPAPLAGLIAACLGGAGPIGAGQKGADLGGLGVAVSGGSDSLALLLLIRDWAENSGVPIAAVTVDHGLRPESRGEAQAVARLCADLGVAHQTLRWQGWDGHGNLPDQARRARYRLIADWAGACGLGAVALGHTADDQAETFLMRLARGSGVDGLSAMSPRRLARGILWLRPLLAARREALRGLLTGRGIAWADDPGNDDPDYLRIRARRALPLLEPLGIDVEVLVATAARLAATREVLDIAALALAHASCRIEAGDVVIDRAVFAAAACETRLRVLAHALRWIGSADYPPRRTALEEAETAWLTGKTRTLAGVLLTTRRGALRLTREYRAVRDAAAPAGAVWDGRWRLSAPAAAAPGAQVRALGAAGLGACPDWRSTGLPRLTLLASPSVWADGRLLAAPLAGKAAGWRAWLARGEDDFFTSLIVH